MCQVVAGSVGESGDLDRVVAEDAPAAPGSGAFETSESGSSPSVLALQCGDSALGAGAPFDEFNEPVFGLDLLAALAGLTLPENRDELDTKVRESVIDGCLAVAAIRSDRVRHDTGGSDRSGDGGRQTWRVGWHPRFDLVVDNDPVTVVGDLAGVAELGWVARLPLRIGRASLSCRDTRRVLLAGISPARRTRV